MFPRRYRKSSQITLKKTFSSSIIKDSRAVQNKGEEWGRQLWAPVFPSTHRKIFRSVRPDRVNGKPSQTRATTDSPSRNRILDTNGRAILKRAAAYSSGLVKRCNLCLVEKLCIMEAGQKDLLNKRYEIISKCRHA